MKRQSSGTGNTKFHGHNLRSLDGHKNIDTRDHNAKRMSLLNSKGIDIDEELKEKEESLEDFGGFNREYNDEYNPDY